MFRRSPFLLAACVLSALVFTGRPAGAAEGGLCSQPTYATVPAAPLKPLDKAAQKQELDQKVFVEADQANLTQGGVSQLSGGVKVRQGDKEFKGQDLDYDDTRDLVTVESESVFSNPNIIIKSQTAHFDLNDDSGAFGTADFTLPATGARGTSAEIAVARDGQAQLTKVVYTTCPEGSDSWSMEAGDIQLDQQKGVGTAHDAILRFQGVPVLYVPWMQFPLNNNRETGLLFPTIGDTNKTGFDARWPVYLNLAPNYDATITPREMSERGLQLGSSGRYLLEQGEGSAGFDYLGNDREYGHSRSLARLDHANLFTPNLGFEATYARVSDDKYFEDLGGSFASSAILDLERSARLTYQSPGSYRITALAQTFQVIDTSTTAVQDPYKRLPEIHFDTLTRNAFFDTRAGINADYVDFVHDGAVVEGQRFDLQPYLRYQHDQNAWYVTSQVDWHYTAYALTGTGYSSFPDQPASPSRSLPVLSTETGLRFDRITTDGTIQTLEPRLFALYVPYRNQDRLPIFDTGEPDFDFTQLFARNRFFGEDRISDAANLTGALTTRVIDPDTGDTRWSASFGQIYHFQASRVDLPGVDAPGAGATDFITEADYNFSSKWSTAAIGQWSPDKSQLVRTDVSLRYRDPTSGSRFDVAYRDRHGLLEQTDLSFDLPVGESWRLGARSRYSLRDSKILENFFGATYQTCCWAVSAAYREYIASSNGNLNSGFYLQLEFKGLGQLGTSFATLLPSDDGDDESLPGSLGASNSMIGTASGRTR